MDYLPAKRIPSSLWMFFKIPLKIWFLGKENAIGLTSWYFGDKFYTDLYRKFLSQLGEELQGIEEFFYIGNGKNNNRSYWIKKLLNRAELIAWHSSRTHLATYHTNSEHCLCSEELNHHKYCGCRNGRKNSIVILYIKIHNKLKQYQYFVNKI